MFFSLFFLTNCGRKNRSLFSFPTEKVEKINTLDLPSVRCLHVERVAITNIISWQPVTSPKDTVTLVGYEVYRLNQQGFIARSPLNDVFLTVCEFVDQHTVNDHLAYVVRAVFKKNDSLKRGPVSQVVAAQ
ncbi:hypothetical protein K2X40_04535 [Candidatus Babeliales bacterium]|nr:hypothetical protein [Candidatus Babeliales bacterium]